MSLWQASWTTACAVTRTIPLRDRHVTVSCLSGELTGAMRAAQGHVHSAVRERLHERSVRQHVHKDAQDDNVTAIKILISCRRQGACAPRRDRSGRGRQASANRQRPTELTARASSTKMLARVDVSRTFNEGRARTSRAMIGALTRRSALESHCHEHGHAARPSPSGTD